MKENLNIPHFFLLVNPESLPLFTTVLQSGIEVMSRKGEMIGHFLSTFEGFTPDYLADTVQTIFLNGTAVDDLTISFNTNTPVLALSAAMQGLAGAIFRKNSFHAALRTETSQSNNTNASDQPIIVTLKLFNSIAVERGPALLHRGVQMTGQSVSTFFAKRESLFPYIRSSEQNNASILPEDLSKLCGATETIHLTIRTSHD